jgi:hypothetical protein
VCSNLGLRAGAGTLDEVVLPAASKSGSDFGPVEIPVEAIVNDLTTPIQTCGPLNRNRQLPNQPVIIKYPTVQSTQCGVRMAGQY